MMQVLQHLAYVLAAVVAITALLIGGLALGIEWCRGVFRAWDYLGAALFGGDGRHSISAYVGAHLAPGWQVLEVLIDSAFGAGHCRKAAIQEGLLSTTG